MCLFLWFLIIPKWLIDDPWSIATFRWMISGTTKNVTKSRPSDPVFITKILQKIQEHLKEQPWNILFLHIWEYEILKVLEGLCTRLFEILKSETLKTWIFEMFNFEKWTFGNWTFETWQFGGCFLEMWNFENSKIGKWELTIWKLRNYNFWKWNVSGTSFSSFVKMGKGR